MSKLRDREVNRMEVPPPPAQMPARSAEDEGYDIRIAADGTWFHEGRPIRRLPLVKLFSTVLRRDEAGDFWLITPAERGRIKVDDAPFVAVELARSGEGEAQALAFRTNVDQWVTADGDHPIRVELTGDAGEPRPYVRVRDRLDALIVRSVFYELAELAVERNGTTGVWSGGSFFALDGRQ